MGPLYDVCVIRGRECDARISKGPSMTYSS